MNEGMDVPKPFPIFNPQLHAQLLPLALLIQAQIEGEERAERQARADEFVRRYPYGCDVKPPEKPQQEPIKHLIPYYVEEAIWKNVLDELRAGGYSEAGIAKIRQLLETPEEPVLISIEAQE